MVRPNDILFSLAYGASDTEWWIEKSVNYVEYIETNTSALDNAMIWITQLAGYSSPASTDNFAVVRVQR